MMKKFGCLKIFLILMVVFIAFRVYYRPPTESEMITNFYSHEAEFKRLNEMISQDRTFKAVGSNWKNEESREPSSASLHPNIIPQKQVEDYRNRMKALGVKTLIYSKHWRKFTVFGGGFAGETWSVGYVWSLKPTGPIVKSAYSLRGGMRGTTYYSPIKGNWYLYRMV